MKPDFAEMREAMVESQLRSAAVDDPRVVRAMARVPREAFVPADKRALAYAEMLLPIGEGRRLNLPMATGKLLTELALTPADKVLVIGAATGYAAAVCAELAGMVIALEELPLANDAATALVDYANVEPVIGPLNEGWAAAAPYDAILIDGAIEQVPDAIAAQLAEGGRLVTALIDKGISRLAFGRKQGGAFGMIEFADAQSTILPGFERPKTFTF